MVSELTWEAVKDDHAGQMWCAHVPGGHIYKQIWDVPTYMGDHEVPMYGNNWVGSICFVPDVVRPNHSGGPQ